MQEYWFDSDAVEELKMYLLNHESDIALNINDFGYLRGIFDSIFDREPKNVA